MQFALELEAPAMAAVPVAPWEQQPIPQKAECHEQLQQPVALNYKSIARYLHYEVRLLSGRNLLLLLSLLE